MWADTTELVTTRASKDRVVAQALASKPSQKHTHRQAAKASDSRKTKKKKQKTKQKAQETNKQGPTNEEPHKKERNRQKTKTDLHTNYMSNSMSTFHRPRKLSHEGKPKNKKKQHSFSQRRSHADPKPEFTQEFPTNKIIERNKGQKKRPPPTSAKRRRWQQHFFFFQERLGEVLGNVDATKGKDIERCDKALNSTCT